MAYNNNAHGTAEPNPVPVPDLDDTPPTGTKVNWEDPVGVRRLRKDLRGMAAALGDREVRGLIETYYMLQHGRIQTGNRIAAIKRGDSAEQPPLVLQMFHAEQEHLEALMKPPIEAYVKGQPVGRWLLSVKGIGPILAGALLSHIDITKAGTAAAIERYAGIDPTVRWERGQRRPWNADLKKTLFLVGESFVKVKNRDGAYYGAYYAARKEQEVARNERGELAPAAARILAERGARGAEDAEWTAILSTGKLPPFLIDKRARRKVIGLFINHLFEVMYTCHHGHAPPFKPYVIDILGHKDYLPVPGWPMAS